MFTFRSLPSWLNALIVASLLLSIVPLSAQATSAQENHTISPAIAEADASAPAVRATIDAGIPSPPIDGTYHYPIATRAFIKAVDPDKDHTAKIENVGAILGVEDDVGLHVQRKWESNASTHWVHAYIDLDFGGFIEEGWHIQVRLQDYDSRPSSTDSIIQGPDIYSSVDGETWDKLGGVWHPGPFLNFWE